MNDTLMPGGTPDDFSGPDWRDAASDAGWIDPDDVSVGVMDILKERVRQQDVAGWTHTHDDGHDRGEMAKAAAVYALWDTRSLSTFRLKLRQDFWPWDADWWNPSDRRQNLVKAGALIAAEIERLDRIER